MEPGPYSEYDIAIIGMAGRFPGAVSLERFWENLVDEADCNTRFERQELLNAGVSPVLVDNPDFVPVAPVLENADLFDAPFFGYSPLEAKTMDPQQRQLLEVGWTALEDSGIAPSSFDGRIGVFAGTAMNTYFIQTGLHSRFDNDYLPTLLGNDKDFQATRLAFKLGLRGPAITVQTACSTSLVSIHLASQSLLSGESDAALVAAAAVRVPLATGHLYADGSIFSKDGRCRPFDAAATGTIFGSGAAAIVLKRAEQAFADGDDIRAIVRGSAVNNDGQEKSDFTAPSVTMQASAITEALAAADTPAESIDYVEAHGTGTYLGDPIEVAALTRAFTADTDRTGYCRIGSVKSNIGHLDAAAGLAGVIKTVLSLENEKIPATLHLETPNPEIDFASSPFVPTSSLTEWARDPNRPRRAGVTSLGMGGTNAHVVIEEAQPRSPVPPTSDARPTILLTAHRTADLNRLASSIGNALETNEELQVHAASTTLSRRERLGERRVVLPADRGEMISALRDPNHWLNGGVGPTVHDRAIFLFTGQGAQFPNMGAELAESDEVFAHTFREVAAAFGKHLDIDLEASVWGPEAAADRLAETWLTQPALFTLEYALMAAWKARQLTPVAAVGHSIGELAAVAASGMLAVEDAIALVAARATAMWEADRGAMYAVEATVEEIGPVLSDGVEVSVVNGVRSLVLGCAEPAESTLQQRLIEADISHRRLQTSHAFHTSSMDDAAKRVAEVAANFPVSPPAFPVLSNVTAEPLTVDDLADGSYWGRHVRSTVRFADCVGALLRTGPARFVEVGPAATLRSTVSGHPERTNEHHVRSTLPRDAAEVSDTRHMAATEDWLRWSDQLDRTPLTVRLPTYPFSGERHWFNASTAATAPSADQFRAESTDDWTFAESFAPLPPSAIQDLTGFDRSGTIVLGAGSDVLGDALRSVGEDHDWLADIDWLTNGEAVLEGLVANDALPRRLVRRWNAEADPFTELTDLLGLLKAVSGYDLSESIVVIAVTQHATSPLPGHRVDPMAALVRGAIATARQEFETIQVKHVDVGDDASQADIAAAVLDEAQPFEAIAHGNRWTTTVVPVSLADHVASAATTLITGGFGGLGSAVARSRLTAGDHVILTSSRPLDASHAAAIEALQALGTVTAAQLVLVDRTQVSTALADLQEQHGPIDRVLHLAGAAHHELVANITSEAVSSTFEPKVLGTANLAKACAEIGAELITTGSIAATRPEPGQSAYSAATAAQAAWGLAEPHVRTVAFTSLTGVGMETKLSSAAREAVRASAMPVDAALEILDRFLGSSARSIIVSPIHPDQLGLAHQMTSGVGDGQSASGGALDTTGLTPTEASIAGIWNRLLGHERIDSDDRFDELGGTSLLAVKLVSIIERDLGVFLPVEALIDAPTLGSLALLVQSLAESDSAPEVEDNDAEDPGLMPAGVAQSKALSSAPPSLVHLRPGEGSKLALIHAHGGTVLSYQKLADQLRDDIDVVAFQSRGVNGDGEPLAVIEDMAAAYLDELRALQPEGPYHLGGFCMGGTIAWEMAAQLERIGETVGSLFMIQAFSRTYPEFEDASSSDRLRRAAHDQVSLAEADAEQESSVSKAILRSVRARGYDAVMRMAQPISSGRRSHLARIGRINDESFWAYTPAPIAVPPVYLRAAIQPHEAIFDASLGFADFHTTGENDGEFEIPGHFNGRFVELGLADVIEAIEQRL